MMKSITFIFAFGILVFGFAFQSVAQQETEKEKTVTTGQEIELAIEGMVCSMCEQNCKKSLETLDGVKVESISASEGVARLTYTGTEPVSDKTLKEAVENAGYKLKKVERKDKTESGSSSDQ